MTDLKKIEFMDLNLNIIKSFLNDYFVLTSGTIEDNNMMTIAWGSIGGMWEKPFIQVVVRPVRHTYQFMEKYNSFTVCAFPKQYRNDLMTLGTKSGKNLKKITDTKLTLCPSKEIQSPSYKEAELILECNKIYFQDIEPENILKKEALKLYPNKDFHRIYFGEILAIFGSERYIKND